MKINNYCLCFFIILHDDDEKVDDEDKDVEERGRRMTKMSDVMLECWRLALEVNN